ncbi:MAG: flagellin lysine-N-methylase [Oscillospiraceae bacterium]|nr:flagellin lysine-N-methylase [Oscillospiraceae bacterium]
MQNQTLKVLVPSYYEKFSCIGSACEKNCCEAGWDIFIDKSTYNLYRNIKDPDFKKELPNRVKRVRGEEASDHHYAYIALDENDRCSYLKDGMCSIQLEHGFKSLCFTCLIYPRNQIRKIGEVLESALSMSCPEAVRIGLYSTEPMTFKFTDLEKTHSKSLASFQHIRFEENTKNNPLAGYAIALRHACINIMQTRRLPVSDRILAIGMMLNKIREAVDVGDWDVAPVIAQKYAAMAAEGQFDGLLASFADNEDIKATIKTKIFITAMSFEKPGKYRFPNFIPCVDRLGESLGKKTEELVYLELSTMVEKGAEKYWQEFLEKRGHILENYFVNYIFANAFPFISALGIQHQILLLAETYALLRVLLCAPALHDYGITEENLIESICDVYRISMHGQMVKRMTEDYILSGMDKLAHMSFLLRD